MARKTNARATHEAIRADIQEAIDTRVADYAKWQQINPTAYDLWQTMKWETPVDYARYGLDVCFERHLGCSGGGFMSEVSYEDERDAVARWLDQTPQEAEKYSLEKVDELYRNLVWREFRDMVSETAPKEGLVLEYTPKLVRNAEGKRELGATVDLYRSGYDGAPALGSYTGSTPAAADVYRVLKSVIETDDPNVYRVDDGDLKGIPGPIYDAIMENERRIQGRPTGAQSVSELMAEIGTSQERALIREAKQAVDDWSANRISEKEMRERQEEIYQQYRSPEMASKANAEYCADLYVDQYEQRRRNDPDSFRNRQEAKAKTAQTQTRKKQRAPKEKTAKASLSQDAKVAAAASAAVAAKKIQKAAQTQGAR